ncbi:uncharacterized protein EURHEDRAFT_398577 [Aspergillus ruber CBS 135680]|uniref:Chromosome segregation ATPase family protein n=1 Tax=Aspergillus ruber (strain CBS 135680) TaxID=1388766 RepID=A0A017SQY0_ASPRC|nr:uncharacterized protein EURHEDRAFT_398577 [Aspergillus ruber CBS 135680]EYE99377.1 hypothetical protein EURHEDRAFT_398577 [Aspergillus ruber CBS 135680]
MPHNRDASRDSRDFRDRDMILRSQTVPISDPERAPPPLPINPGTSSPTTKSNVSPKVQAVAANFAEKCRDNVASPYTTNPMPPKPVSPEKSLIKGNYHKRMQSMQNTDTKSEFLNFLESKSPEKSLRASVLDASPKSPKSPKSPEKVNRKLEDAPADNQEGERDPPPHFAINHRYLSKPILNEPTPPSATMLALQNMQLPTQSETSTSSRSKESSPTPFIGPQPAGPQSDPGNPGLESLSTQIHSLTDIASNLQREMAQLSRRSKDNATDLISLKAATNSRDEDIRKSLRELSSNLTTKFLDAEASGRWDYTSIFGSDPGISHRDRARSPNARKSHSIPRMPSPGPFAAAMERDLCGSPGPISDGSASIALLEKILREMATREGQENLLDAVDEIKSRPMADAHGNNADRTTTDMLEEILQIVKNHSGSQALVRSKALAIPFEGNPDSDRPRARSLDPEQVLAPDMEILHSDSGLGMEPQYEYDPTQEMLHILKRVKTSVIEGGGMTNEVKALVRELRGEVLGMGRNIAEKLEEDERARSVEGGKTQPLAKEEVAAVVDASLADLKELLASVVNESRESSSAFAELRSSMNGDEIYSIVKQALDEQSSESPHGDDVRKEEILETIREGWETYKPEIELQNFGLERDEILECLSEGLKSYQPQHEGAVTYDQVLAAVQAGMQDFEQPQSITKDEIVQTIRETLTGPEAAASRSLVDEQVTRMKDEILQAVTESVTSQNALTRDTLKSGVGRDEVLRAVSDGIEAHFSPSKRLEQPQVTKEDVTDAINEAFSARHSALSTQIHSPPLSRDEVLSAIAQGLENHNPIAPEIELNKDDFMDAISAALNETSASTSNGIGDKVLERFHEVLGGMKNEFKQYSDANGKENHNVLNAVKDGVDVIRKEIEGYAANAGESSGKTEILETVKEGFKLLQADMEKVVADASFANMPRGNPDTPELLDAMEKEFEHLRQSITSMLMRSDLSSDKEEILDAINDVMQFPKDQLKKEDLEKTIKDQFENQPAQDEVIKTIKEEFEKISETMNTTLAARSEPTRDKEDIIAALRQSLETFQDEATRSKSGGEALLLNAFNDGVGAIKSDLAKVLDKPAAPDATDLLESLKEGLAGLKAEVEAIRKSQLDADEAIANEGKELTLAKEVNRSDNVMDGLRVMVGQLQAKVETIEAPPAPEPAEDALKKDHLDEVVEGLKELRQSVTGIQAREISAADEVVAKKQDTDAIEELLRNTKVQLDELKFPVPDEIAKSQQISALENVVKEAKDAISELSNRIESEGPTKTEIGTLESLLKDMWIAFDEFKSKSESKEEDPEKLAKSDLQTVEAMIFEVKTQIEELKLPDVETLPTKTDIEGLSTLVTQFREKTEADNELTAQRFDTRKKEHDDIAEKVDAAKAVVEKLGDELKSKLDGSGEGLSELKQVLGGLASSAQYFTTVENIKELSDLITKEFEQVRSDQEASKSEREEKDAVAVVKHDEHRAAIIAELGTKIDEKVGEVVAKYDEAQNAMDAKFYATEERDNAGLEAITNTKALAEDIKLVIGAMDNSFNESCEQISIDTKALFEKVDESYSQIKTSQEQARADAEKTAATTDRLETELHQFHPQVLEGVQEVLTIIGQHYGHSQRSTQDIKTDISSLPSSIVRLLPPAPEVYDDTKAQEKLDILLGHARDTHVQDALNVIVERVTSEQVHQKLDQLMSHSTSTNTQVYDKLEELLGHAINSNGPVHDKLDTLIGHATNTDQSVTQMMKLDEIHKDMMESSRRMQEMLVAQSAMMAEDNNRKRKEAEEAAVALERRNAEKEQVEAEIENFRDEKESLLKIISSLKSEKEDLSKQNAKTSKELSGLEMALELRNEEMQVMEERAESLEKRILEGVLDHARSVLVRGPKRTNSKRARGTRARGPSASNGSKDGRVNTVATALKKRPSQKESNKERRIFSLNHVASNRGPGGDRQVSNGSGIASLKRSHSVKSNMSQRKSSWTIANKENDAFPEGDESDTGTERRTSYLRNVSDAEGDDDDAQTTKGDDETDDLLDHLDEEAKRLVLYKKHQATDSGVGTEISSGAE